MNAIFFFFELDIIALCSSPIFGANASENERDWVGNTYVFDIAILRAMDSHQVAYHRHHKCVVTMKLDHRFQWRVEFVHCHVFHRCCYRCCCCCHNYLVGSIASLMMDTIGPVAENYWIAHSTHEDIDRYRFHIEDFVNSSLYDVLIDLETALKHLDNRKLIDNHRLHFRGCNTNLQKG